MTTGSSGDITTENLVPAGVATPSSAVELELNGDYDSIAIQVTGTYTGALTLQGTVDGKTWVSLGGANPLTNVNTGVAAATIASAAAGIFATDVSGFLKIRVTALAAVTGTATVVVRSTEASGNTSALSVTVDSEFGAPVASADGAANPTAPQTLVYGHVYNGSTWDRLRGTTANGVDVDVTRLPTPSTTVNGQNTVAAAGTAEALGATTTIVSVTIKALTGNTGNIYVGDSGVTSANGFVLSAGESISLDVDNLDAVFIDADTSSEGVSYIGVV